MFVIEISKFGWGLLLSMYEANTVTIIGQHCKKLREAVIEKAYSYCWLSQYGSRKKQAATVLRRRRISVSPNKEDISEKEKEIEVAAEDTNKEVSVESSANQDMKKNNNRKRNNNKKKKKGKGKKRR